MLPTRFSRRALREVTLRRVLRIVTGVKEKKRVAAGKIFFLKFDSDAGKKGLLLHGVLSLHFVKAALILRRQTNTYGEITKGKSFVDLRKC